MEVNVRLLRCLVAVVDEGHFGRAAQRLYISGPSLSQQIRKLESQVKLTLLDRRSHPVRPTSEAAEFVEA
ncbi:MAG TPA: LysR family transcriptional regulator, partial [Pseudonocardia sp.]